MLRDQYDLVTWRDFSQVSHQSGSLKDSQLSLKEPPHSEVTEAELSNARRLMVYSARDGGISDCHGRYTDGLI